MELLEPEMVANSIKIWITNIKKEYQIYDYEYSNDFYIGIHNNKKIYLKVTTIPPNPTIEYNIENINQELKEFMSKIIEFTKIIPL